MSRLPPKPPSSVATLAAAVVALVIGAVLALVKLAFIPMVEVTRLPALADREPGTVYYLRGSSGGGQQWRAKQAAAKQGFVGDIVWTEGELNQWAQATIRPTEPSREADAPTPLFLPGTVNFRFLPTGEVQLATFVTVPVLGSARFIYTATGVLEDKTFVPTGGALGHAPIGAIPVVDQLVFDFVSGAFAEAEEVAALAAVWERAEAVEVTPDGLRLSLR